MNGRPPIEKRRAFSRRDQRTVIARQSKNGLTFCAKCETPLATFDGNDWTALKSIEFDHVIALSNGGEHSADNCNALCKRCHSRKTAEEDTPRAAKIKRQAGLVGQQQRRMAGKSRKIQSRGFQQW